LAVLLVVGGQVAHVGQVGRRGQHVVEGGARRGEDLLDALHDVAGLLADVLAGLAGDRVSPGLARHEHQVAEAGGGRQVGVGGGGTDGDDLLLGHVLFLRARLESRDEGPMIRQGFLRGMTALGASALPGRGRAEGQMATTTPHRIDVHHHHTPPPYLAALVAKNVIGPVRDWTPDKSLADMDRAGVATALTSITTPALRFLDEAGARPPARGGHQETAKPPARRHGRLALVAAPARAPPPRARPPARPTL